MFTDIGIVCYAVKNIPYTVYMVYLAVGEARLYCQIKYTPI